MQKFTLSLLDLKNQIPVTTEETLTSCRGPCGGGYQVARRPEATSPLPGEVRAWKAHALTGKTLRLLPKCSDFHQMRLAGQLSRSVHNSSDLQCETTDSIRVRNYIKIALRGFFFPIFKSMHDVEKELLVRTRSVDVMPVRFFF